MLRSSIAVAALAGSLLLAATAAAHVLSLGYARQVTHDVAKRLYQTTRDAESFGARGCRRRDDHHVRCTGFVSGHSLDADAGSQPWRCEFLARYKLTGLSGGDFQGFKVRANFSPANCTGRGAGYIQRRAGSPPR